jgi:hypothetical protein
LSDKSQNLSDILREVRAHHDGGEAADPTMQSGGAIRSHFGYGSANLEKANTNFVILFERADGMVNLEGLELLSTNYKTQNSSLKVNG